MGLACFVFASIKKRPSVTKSQVIREALEPIYGFGEAVIIGAPSFKQCILLVSRMNRTDGFEICRIALWFLIQSIKSLGAALWEKEGFVS